MSLSKTGGLVVAGFLLFVTACGGASESADDANNGTSSVVVDDGDDSSVSTAMADETDDSPDRSTTSAPPVDDDTQKDASGGDELPAVAEVGDYPLEAMNGPGVCQIVSDLSGLRATIGDPVAAGAKSAAMTAGLAFGSAVVNDLRDLEAAYDAALAADCRLIVVEAIDASNLLIDTAVQNPSQSFLLVDAQLSKFINDTTPINENGNVAQLAFAVNEGSFLAGYAAAAQSQTGIVAVQSSTPGQFAVPYFEGFALGVAHYNNQSGDTVSVLGYTVGDLAASGGPGLADPDKARQTTYSQADGGADIIFHIGPSAFGTLLAAQERDLRVVGFDSDFRATYPDFTDVILTSALKKKDVAVEDAVTNLLAGGTQTLLEANLANEGVGIAPITNPTDAPDSLASELDLVGRDIIDGNIATLSPS